MVASACGKVTIREAAKQQFSPVADVNGSFCREPSQIALPPDKFRSRDIICISIESSEIVAPPPLNLISPINFLSLR